MSTSTLPPPAFCPAVEYNVVREINATVDQVWSILTDLPSYPEWNPFLRSAVMVDASSHEPLESPVFHAGTVAMAMQVPPTMNTEKKPMVGYEQVSLVDHDAHRLIWGGGRVPALFRAETVISLTQTADNQTRFEMRKAYGGASGYMIKGFMGGVMRECPEGMADALKQRAERA